MTRTGVYELLGVLCVAYPHFYVNATNAEKDLAAAVWGEMLKDIDDNVALAALKRIIATNKFPPTPAEMLESVRKITNRGMLDAGEAWQKVNCAILQYGYYRESEGLDSLDETTRKAAQYIGWRELCLAPLEQEMANRAHFMKMFETIAARAKERQLIPKSIQDEIAKIIKTVDGLPQLEKELLPALNMH